ncbi:MAG: ATP-dependent protease subunit HslV [bacterium]|nr:ATP-dependent protease subunit HslV [bacterium]
MDHHHGTRPTARATTIVCLRHRGCTAMAGDGQVSFGDMVLKNGAVKIRSLRSGHVLAGFAGAAADAFALFDRFDQVLEARDGDLTTAVVEMAKEWRLDKAMQRLDAILLVADAQHIYMVSGTGDIIEPDEPLLAIGSGGPYALAAAKALLAHAKLDAASVAREALHIAADICVYTNHSIQVEVLGKRTEPTRRKGR